MKPSKRVVQFGLRGMLLVMVVAGLSMAAYLQPFRERAQAASALKALGCRVETITSGPDWLIRLVGDEILQTATVVDTLGLEPDKYLPLLADCPDVEIVCAGGPHIEDDHAKWLLRRPALKAIVLDSTSVTDEVIENAALKHPAVGIRRSPRSLVKQFYGDGDLTFRVVHYSFAAMHYQIDPWGQRSALMDSFVLPSELVLAEPSALHGRVADEYLYDVIKVSCSSPERLDPVLRQLHHFPALVELSIGGGKLHAETLEKLQDCHRLCVYSAIDVQDTETVGLKHIAHPEQVRYLDLRKSNLSEDDLQQLAKFTQLRYLNLAGAKLAAARFDVLAKCALLEYLNLDHCEVTGPDLVHLSGLLHLRQLSLEYNPISGGGLAQLRSAERLQILSISGSDVNDSDIGSLVELKQLRQLEMWGVGMTIAGLEQLREGLPRRWIKQNVGKE